MASRYRWLLLPALASACSEPRDDDDGAGTLTTTVGTAAASSEAGETTSASTLDTGMLLDIGAGTNASAGEEGGTDDCVQDIDIVFVMDVSTSMGPFLSKLADEILVVDQALADLGLPSAPHYGLAVFVDDSALLNMGAPYLDAETLRSEFTMWSTFTSTNSQVSGGGSNSTWPENSLDALYAAAVGFQWRPSGDDTLRLIIHTTDDAFWNGPTTADGVDILHGYDETVDALQQAEIRTFSFAAQIGGSCECEDVTPGWSAPYQGQPALPEATDGGVFDIDLVLAGQLSLSAAINGLVEDTMCEPYTPVG
ncbi:MAG: hypothetical protein IAG13_21210 [Deltaproteobacteria bacterium]|nr:hypothetical protein [Nannocystaceae bacterium]